MAIASSTVSAGDDILANQYNDLRADLLTNDITIAGVKTFSNDMNLSSNLNLAATKFLYLDGGGNTYIYESAADNIRFMTGGLQALDIDSSQNIVIQATKYLYFDGGGDTYIYESAGNYLRIKAGGNDSIAAGDTAVDVYQDMKLTATKKLYLDGGSDTYIYESANDIVNFYANGSNQMAIADGNVTFGSATDAILVATRKLYLDGGGDTYIYESAGDYLRLVAGSNTVIGCGPTSIDVYQDMKIPATKKFYLDGGANTYVYESAADNVDFYIGGNLNLTLTGSTCVAQHGIHISTGASDDFWIDNASHGSASATLYIGDETIDTTPVSDEQAKENIVLSTKGLQEILGLQVKEYTYKPEYRDDGTVHVGFIASEVETVFPQAVFMRSDEFKTVNTKALIPLLVKAIQELEARISTLEGA